MKKLIYIFSFFLVSFLIEAQTENCSAPSKFKYLTVNDVAAKIPNNGQLWTIGNWETIAHQVPKIDPPGSAVSKNIIYGGGIWMGGIAGNGQLKVAAMTYAQNGNDYWSGPIEDGETEWQTCNAWNEVFEVTYDEVHEFYYDGVITDNLLSYPAKNNPHLQNEIGASLPDDENYFPFYDVNNDNKYDPNDGDYPNITGDQSLYWLMNDIGNEHTETGGEALGVEIMGTAYAYNQYGLDTTTFYRFEITNKSNSVINDYHFGLWVDVDLGKFDDDFVGVDTVNNFAYVYNGDADDNDVAGYGTNIPIAAIVLLDAAKETNSNESKLGAFVYYNNDFTQTGNPEHALHYYNYLQATWKNGQHITYGDDGFNPYSAPTNFMFSSPPNQTTDNAWSECANNNTPADRRLLLGAKPIDLDVGQTVKYEIAVVTTFDTQYPCPDIKPLQESVEYVQAYYDNYIKAQLLSTNINDEEIVTNAIKIFPNPIQDRINIESITQFESAHLYDLQGRAVLQDLKIENNSIGLSNFSLAKGNYILKLKDSEGKVALKKVALN